jgi:hypothetical protein
MENISSNLCTECNKKKIRCKGICNTCYSRRYRKTEKGKEITKKYNESPKGKEAQKKYFAKKKLLSPPKLKNNEICSCGKTSKIKGFCDNCYRKNYARTKKVFLKKLSKEYSITNDVLFKSLLKKVEEGMTISGACKLLNINRGYLYNQISPSQKLELKQMKILSNNSSFKGFEVEEIIDED